jgi:hypothetical protein
MPDGAIYKPCGNRRTSVCPGCAETYRRDAYHIIRAGLIGGKGVSPAVATHTAHPERLIAACWDLGADPDYASLRRWGHMLGFGGHFLTKGRRYSVRFVDLRQARVSYRRGQDTGPEHGPIRTADYTDDETILVIGTFSCAATGWRTTGDALLANTAADQARKRRQAGRDQLADEYSRSDTYGAAA